MENLTRDENYNATRLVVHCETMILLLVDTGIRLGELISLTEAQIKHDYIIIKGKGAKERVVPKSPLLGKWLIKYLSVRNSYFQYRIIPDNIFLSKNGLPLCTAIVDRMYCTPLLITIRS